MVVRAEQKDDKEKKQTDKLVKGDQQDNFFQLLAMFVYLCKADRSGPRIPAKFFCIFTTVSYITNGIFRCISGPREISVGSLVARHCEEVRYDLRASVCIGIW